MSTSKVIQDGTTLMSLPKSTAQASEPTPPAAGSFEVWEQTTDLNRSYLLYRRQDSAIRRIELLNSVPAVGIPTLPVTCTTANITLYVATTGSDSNDGLTVPTALLTIQAAIDKIPKIIKHKVTIEVGTGNFGAFRVSGFSMGTWVGDGADYQFTIRGASFIAWTPATGLGSGTSTGGTTNTLIDAGGGWTAHDLRGKMIYVNGAWLIIRDNDATSLETIGISASTMSGKAYVIQNWATIINTKVDYALHGVPGAATAATSGCIWLDNNTGDRSLDARAIHITRLQINAPATTAQCIHAYTSESAFSYLSIIGTHTVAMYVFNTFNVYLQHIYMGGTGGSALQISGVQRIAGASNLFAYGRTGTGFSFLYCTEISVVNYIYADNGSGTGIQSTYSLFASVSNLYASNNGGAGIILTGIIAGTVSGVTSNNNKYGILINMLSPISSNTTIPGATGITFSGSNVFSNNTDQGFVAGPNASVRCVTVTGTGNGGYGIYAKLGAKVFITSATTITGSSSDVKVGITVGSYAADFATDQSYINDLSEGTIVKRSDVITF